MYFVSKKEKGFTLIELVISIFILSFAVVGIFNAFSIVNILTSDSADRLTGTYLAQEGIEIVRNIRDTNWLNMDAGTLASATWSDGLSCGSGCEADYTTGTGVSGAFAMSPWASRPLLAVAGTNSFYNYTGGTQTKFKRKITINPLTDVDGNSTRTHIMDVIVQVSWNEKATVLYSGATAGVDCNATGKTPNCITVEETLYNWYNTTVPVTGVTLNEPSATLAVGAIDLLTATIAPPDASDQNVTWTSDNPDVATVDNTGKVRAVAIGSANITATADDGVHYATDEITVFIP